MPTVSIALATYNGSRFIAEQLASLATQTHLPNELVVVDDNSTDDTLAKVAAFATKSPFPVRIEKNPERLGYGGNFLKASGLCQYELISFCDQDDVWAPNKLKKCLASFADQTVVLSYHDATIVDANLKPMGIHMGRVSAPAALNPPQSLEPRLHGLGFTMIFRRTLLVLNDQWPKSSDYYHPDVTESHDDWFFFLSSCLGTIAYIHEPLALYRQHGKNVYGWNDPSLLGNMWKRLFETDIQDLKNYEKFAATRASILETAQHKLDGDFRTNAILAAAKYRQLEQGCRERQQLYASQNLWSRLSIITKLLRAGAYKPKAQWGFSVKALIRDVVRGLFIPLRMPNA